MFHLLAALRAELARRGALLQPVQLAGLLDLVALGTVADLVPLDRGNRILVSEGLRRIRAGRASAGLAALIESAGRDPRQLHASDLGFQIGPRLNAAGRLDDMALGIRCLVSDDIDETRELAAQLSELNRERRSLQADMEREAAAIVETLLASRRTGALPAALIVGGSWLACGRGGLGGQSPRRAAAPSDPGFGARRSGRQGVAWLGSLDCRIPFARCPGRTRSPPWLLLRFGGHAMAAGLTVDADLVATLSRAFESVADDLLDEGARSRSVWTDGPLATNQFTLDLARAIENAGPFGQAFAEPLFDNEFSVHERRVLKDKHLKLRLSSGAGRGGAVDAIWFSAPRALLEETRIACDCSSNWWSSAGKDANR